MSEQQFGGFGRGWRGGRQQGWDPMGELQSLRSELSRLVGGRGGASDVELTETSDGWEVVVRLPGVAPEEVAVELDDRELCVRARSEAEVNADQGIPGGFETRGFEYRVNLPSRVDPDSHRRGDGPRPAPGPAAAGDPARAAHHHRRPHRAALRRPLQGYADASRSRSGPGAAPPGHRRRDRPAVAGRVVTPSVLGPTAERLPDVRRIAVLRANALGDFIFALPALDALRSAYPSAEIVLLGAPWHAKLWRDRPGPVDRVLVVPPAPGIRTPEPGEPESSMDDFLAAAAGAEFDLAVQIHGGGCQLQPADQSARRPVDRRPARRRRAAAGPLAALRLLPARGDPLPGGGGAGRERRPPPSCRRWR